MAVLSKSMQELDDFAENLLKSQQSEDTDLNPNDIAENAPSGDNEDAAKTDPAASAEGEKDTPTEGEKGEGEKKDGEEMTKCDDGKGNLKKSEKPDDLSEGEKGEGDEGELQKSSTGDNTPKAKTVNENPANGGATSSEAGKLSKSENGGNDEGESDDADTLQKSFQQQFEDNDSIKQSIDASDFLQAVTEVLSKSLGDNSYNLTQMRDMQTSTNEVLAKSLQATLQANAGLQKDLMAVKSENTEMRKSLGDILDKMDAMMGKIDEMSHQPQSMRKSISNIHAMDRDFGASANGVASGSSLENLSKSEVLGMLNTEMYTPGNSVVQPTDIISYESGAPLRPEVAQILAARLK